MRSATTTVSAALLTLLLVAGACGVPTDGAPRIVALEQAADLSAGALRPTPTPSGPEFVAAKEVLYFLGSDNRLEAVERVIAQLAPSGRAQLVLEALIVGPTDTESSRGLSNGVPLSVVNSVDVSDAGGAIVDMGTGPLEELEGDNLRVAFAQIVYTLTELDGITSFRLRIDGEDRPLPTEFEIVNELEPVGRLDYPSYNPVEELPEEPTPEVEAQDLPATDPESGQMLTPEPDAPEPTATPLPGTPLPDNATPTEVPSATPIPTEDPDAADE